MRKRIISESFENRMQELAGILDENAHKIKKIGFDEKIADYLAGLNKKRGIFLADSLTRQYLSDKGLEVPQNIKQELSNINQEELFQYMKSRENDVLSVLDWIKESQGQVDLKSFNSFNDIVDVAKSEAQQDDNKEEFEFDPLVEKYLRTIDYDFGREIGVLALKDFFKEERPELTGLSIQEMIDSTSQSKFYSYLKSNENDIGIIVDWVNSPVRQEEEGVLVGPEKADFIMSKDFDGLGDAAFAAHEWHTHLTATGKLMDKTAGKVIKRYPDGYYWVDLQTNSSRDEAQAMGHCGTDGRATTLYSLRDPEGEPHVTIAINEKTKNIGQVKGKNNKRPVDKYMKYVNQFLAELVKEEKVYTFRWSYSADLRKEEVDAALSNMSAKAKFKLKKQAARRVHSGSNLGRGANL